MEILVLLYDVVGRTCLAVVIENGLLDDSLLLSCDVFIVVRYWDLYISVVLILHLVNLDLLDISV